jgi:hypothetical protein
LIDFISALSEGEYSIKLEEFRSKRQEYSSKLEEYSE